MASIFLIACRLLMDIYRPSTLSLVQRLTGPSEFVSAILLFVSAFYHELSISYMQRKRFAIARITLFFFGGVSEMSEEPKDAVSRSAWRCRTIDELRIAGVLGGLWYVSMFVLRPVRSSLCSATTP